MTRSHADTDCCSNAPSPSMTGSWFSGSQRSGGSPRSVSPKNPAGATPTIVTGCPCARNVAPTTAGSAPYSSCHTRWLSTPTGAAAGVSSAAVNARPANAPTPSVEK